MHVYQYYLVLCFKIDLLKKKKGVVKIIYDTNDSIDINKNTYF